MAESYLPDIVGQYQRGQAIGTAQREARETRDRQSRLTELAQLAYGAQGPERQAAIGQIYGVDPKFASDLSGQLGKEDESRQTALLQSARLLQSAPPESRPALYQRIRPSLSQYLPDLPPEYSDQVDQGTRAFISAYGDAGGDLPTGFRQLDLQARAAGFEPGTPEYKNYFQVHGGILGRAPTGGFNWEYREGFGYIRTNPRSGTLEVYDPQTRSIVPVVGGADINAPQPTQAPAPAPATAAQGVVVTNEQGERGRYVIAQDGRPVFIAEGVAPNVAQGITADPSGFQQGTAQAPPQITGAPSPAVQRFGDITTRTPEQQAYLNELQKQQAQIDTYRQKAGLEAEGAAAKTFAEETAKAQAAIQNLQAKKSVQANDVLSLLDSAEPLVRRSTGSGIGAGVDALGNLVGFSTEGANAIAALRPIAAALIGNVPRMEGPQSDADRRLYEQAAGDVANPNTPVPQRLASIQTMRRLQEKYKNLNQGDQAPTQQAPSRRLRWNPQTQRLE